MPGATPLWREIAETLRDEIGRRLYPAGTKLPSEAILGARFGVNRHTVRRALADLAGAGLVRPRRGAGVFVTHTSTSYPIGRRVRFHQNLRAAGHVPGKRVLALTDRVAGPAEAAALSIAPGAPVLVCDGLSLSDDVPLALFQSTFPLERAPGMAEALRRTTSVTEALRQCGITDYTRAETRLSAAIATATQAAHLELKAGAPLLHAQSINIDKNGMPVEFGLTWFAGERVTLHVEPDDTDTAAPKS